MIVSYQTGMEFLQDNQAYLQTNPYLSTFFTLDAPLLKQADKINYALRCEQGDKRLLALKIEPYNLLLFGEEACVPELLRFLFDGGYEIKNYLCAPRTWLCADARKCSRMDGAMKRRLPWTLWRRGASPSRPHRRSRQPGKTIWTRSLTARSGLSLTVGCSISREGRAVPQDFGFVPDHPCRRKDCQHGAHCTGYTGRSAACACLHAE